MLSRGPDHLATDMYVPDLGDALEDLLYHARPDRAVGIGFMPRQHQVARLQILDVLVPVRRPDRCAGGEAGFQGASDAADEAKRVQRPGSVVAVGEVLVSVDGVAGGTDQV